MAEDKTGTREEWLAARLELLEAEKELTRRGDELARRREELPWVSVEKEYVFETAKGPETLAELFDGRSQLVVYHFMFGPDYEAGCVTCSSIADSFDGMLPHLAARDVTMVVVSRASLAKLLAYKERMGWRFPWVSSGDSDFSFDFGGSSTVEATRGWVEPILGQLPPIAAQNASASGTDVVHYLSDSQGVSSFVRDGDTVYHTYSSGGRGVEFLMGYYSVLDRVAKGRDEGDDFQTWLRRHDEYGTE
ncbi:MAG TPA: DUF899 domain-containing protein [Gaiellaceae bacterium]|nr:DUF899 domain-containing protein [Gaiellaceae bacterium]